MQSTTGFTYVYFNAADIMNSGIELTVNGKFLQKKDWSAGASVNFAYNYNKVLKYNPVTKSGITSKDRYVEGYPTGAIFSGKLAGIAKDTGLYEFKLRPDAVISMPRTSTSRTITDTISAPPSRHTREASISTLPGNSSG